MNEKYQQMAVGKRRFSNRAFAQFLEIDASTLHKIMRGKRKAGPILIKRISLKLGMEIDDFEIPSAGGE